MSKIIKAAELKVLVTDDTAAIIRPVIDPESTMSEPEKVLDSEAREGTILEASDLISQAKAKAEEIRQEAEEEVEALWAKTKTELEELRNQAQQEGFEAGYGAGYQEGSERADKETARLLHLLEETLTSAAAQRAAALARLEQDFLKLSIILAEKIVKRTIVHDPTWLKPVIEEAYSKLGTVTECVIRLSPDDYQVIQDQDIRVGGAGVERLVFQPDANLSPGDCVIETDSGTIDASLEKRLGKAAQYLMEVVYDEQ